MSSDSSRQLGLRALAAGLGAAGLGGAVWTIWSAATTPGLAWAPEFPATVVAWLALVGIALAIPTTYRASVLWAALALVGYASSLQLVNAGTAVVYQHLRPAVAPLDAEDWRQIAALAAYGAVVLLGLVGHPRLRDARSWMVSDAGAGRVVLVVLAWAALSASPMRDLGAFALEIFISLVLGLLALAAVVLAVMSLPTGAWPRLAGAFERFLNAWHDRKLDPVALGACLFSTIAAGALAYWTWDRHPHISDEISFLFQAKYFARGALAAPGVPAPELFSAYQIDCSVDRCLSVLQPGWPALLSLGVLTGTPWLVNPVLAGVNVLLFFALMKEWYGTALARVAVVLLASSPWYLFLGMSFMNHQATLLGGLLGVLGVTLALQRGAGWALMAGAGAGIASLMRPMDGVIVAAVAGVPLLLKGSVPRRAATVGLFVTGAGVLGAANLGYNRAVTGHPLEFPVTQYVNALWGPGTNNLGFGPDRGVYPMWSQLDAFPGHSPLQALVNAGLNATALQVDLFGWATGSLLPLILLVAVASLSRADRLMLGWIAVIVGFYSLYWFASGPDFAARYWFLAIVPLTALTARGLQALGARIEGRVPGRGRIGVAVAAGVLICQALLVFVPWRSTDKYHRYFGTSPWIRDALAHGMLPDGVYLIRGSNQPDYAAAMIYEAPSLATGDIVFAYDSLPDAPDRLRRSFPTRRIWQLTGPTTMLPGYQVSRLPEAGSAEQAPIR